MVEINISELKQIDFWEVIIPYRGQLGIGGSLPEYLEQGNCDILPNKSGVLIQKEVFLELIDQTTILKDCDGIYFFEMPDDSVNQRRYNTDYSDEKIFKISKTAIILNQ